MRPESWYRLWRLRLGLGSHAACCTRVTVASVTAINPAMPRPTWGARAAQAVTGARRALVAVTTSVKRSRTSLANSGLQLGGLGCIDVSAFQVTSALGWLVTGLSAFTLAWLLQPGGDA